MKKIRSNLKFTIHSSPVEDDIQLLGPGDDGILGVIKASTRQPACKLRYNKEKGEWEMDGGRRAYFDESGQIRVDVQKAIDLAYKKFPFGPNTIILKNSDQSEN